MPDTTSASAAPAEADSADAPSEASSAGTPAGETASAQASPPRTSATRAPSGGAALTPAAPAETDGDRPGPEAGGVPRPTERETHPAEIVLPCLDEAEALPWVLERVPAGWRAIVVDNGSTDGSCDIARDLGATVVHEPRRGFGAACHAGLLAARAEVVCFCDCDASLDPALLVPFVQAVAEGESDLVLGRRRPRSRGVWPAHARVGNLALARMLRARTGLRLHDLGPMRAARRTALLDLNLTDRRSGYPLQMVVRAADAGWRIAERDVPYLPRTGRSKVTGTWRGTWQAVRDMRAVLNEPSAPRGPLGGATSPRVARSETEPEPARPANAPPGPPGDASSGDGPSGRGPSDAGTPEGGAPRDGSSPASTSTGEAGGHAPEPEPALAGSTDGATGATDGAQRAVTAPSSAVTAPDGRSAATRRGRAPGGTGRGVAARGSSPAGADTSAAPAEADISAPPTTLPTGPTGPTTLLVIAKQPLPGRVKTRLSPPFSPEDAARLAEAALVDTLRTVSRSPARRRVLVLDGQPGVWLPPGFEVLPQCAGGLDERLAAAFAASTGPTLLLGMDTPQITPRLLAPALRSDAWERGEAWFGPAADGGFWALGFAEPRPELLRGVPMSVADTGAAQRRRLTEAGLSVRSLPVLRDVDTAEDAGHVAGQAPSSEFARTLARLAVRGDRW